MKQVLVALTLAGASAGAADKLNQSILKIENATRKSEGKVPLNPKDNHYGEVMFNAQRSICPAVNELTAKLPNVKSRELLIEIAKDYAVQGCKECAQTVRNINRKAELIHPAEFANTEKCDKVTNAGIDKLANAHENDKFSVKAGAEEMQAYLCNYLREKTLKLDEQQTQRFVSDVGMKYKENGCYECNDVVYGIIQKFGREWKVKQTINTDDQCEKYVASKVKKIASHRDAYVEPAPHPFNYHLQLEGGAVEADRNLCKFIADVTFLDTRDKAVKKVDNLYKSYMSKKFECPQCAEAVKVILVESETFPDIYNYARSGKCKSTVSKILNAVPGTAGDDFNPENGALAAIRDLCPYVAKASGGMNDKQEQALLKKISADFTKSGCPGCSDAVNNFPSELTASGKPSLAQYAASSKCKAMVKNIISDSVKLDVNAGLDGMTQFCQYVGLKTGDISDDRKAKEWFDKLSMKYRKSGCNDCADVVYQLYQKAQPNIQFFTHSQQCIKLIEGLTKKAHGNSKYALNIQDGLVSMPSNLCGFIAEKTAKADGNLQYAVTLKLAQQYSAAGCEKCVEVIDELTVKSVKEGGLHKFTSTNECDKFVLSHATRVDGGVIRN